MSDHQKIQDDAIKQLAESLQALTIRLPQDYMPREEILENRERTKEMRDQQNQRLDKIESKVDQVLINHAHNHPSK